MMIRKILIKLLKLKQLQFTLNFTTYVSWIFYVIMVFKKQTITVTYVKYKIKQVLSNQCKMLI